MHSYTLKIFGEASQKTIAEFHFEQLPALISQGLMGWLREQKIPIASSCYGDGVCRRCKVVDQHQGEILSCMTTFEELFSQNKETTISIGYL